MSGCNEVKTQFPWSSTKYQAMGKDKWDRLLTGDKNTLALEFWENEIQSAFRR